MAVTRDVSLTLSPSVTTIPQVCVMWKFTSVVGGLPVYSIATNQTCILHPLQVSTTPAARSSAHPSANELVRVAIMLTTNRTSTMEPRLTLSLVCWTTSEQRSTRTVPLRAPLKCTRTSSPTRQVRESRSELSYSSFKLLVILTDTCV